MPSSFRRQPVGGGDVPQQVVRRTGMREAVQCAIQPRKPACPSPVAVRRCARSRGSARRPGRSASARSCAGRRPTRSCRACVLPVSAQRAAPAVPVRPGDVVERRNLEVDDRRRLGWIADLDDVATAVRRLDAAVLVTFARQWLDGALDAVEAADQCAPPPRARDRRGGAQRGCCVVIGRADREAGERRSAG